MQLKPSRLLITATGGRGERPLSFVHQHLLAKRREKTAVVMAASRPNDWSALSISEGPLGFMAFAVDSISITGSHPGAA